MTMTSSTIGDLAAEAKTSEVKAVKPNINNPVPVVSKPVLNTEQLKEAATQMSALTPKEDTGFRMNKPGTPSPVADATVTTAGATDDVNLNSLDPYGNLAERFTDEIEAEERAAKEVLTEANKVQLQTSGKSIRDLIEDDAYDLDVPLYAGVAFNPNLLKVEMVDPNYVARWGNTNNIRQTMLVSQGFTFCTEKEVRNLGQLSMFLDSLGHFVWADLVAMKIPKNIYYAGLRRSYIKSLHATNKTKAAQAGAAYAKSILNNSLSGAERSYMVNQAKDSKEVYTPVAGV